jgi:NPCBM-associated, NEW3 domain of alpha-galactosidase
VTISNFGDGPASGQATVTAPEGWTVDPASAPFGPVDVGKSATVTFHVAVPAGTEPGSYPLRVNAGGARGTGLVTVIGDTIEFDPQTDEEAPWLFERDGSQVDGGGARFADGGNHYTYRFQLPSDVTGGTLTLDLGAEFKLSVSPDNQTWRVVAFEPDHVHALGNRADRTFDLNDLRGDSHTLYLRFEDSHVEDGWGAWLRHLKLELDRP